MVAPLTYLTQTIVQEINLRDQSLSLPQGPRSQKEKEGAQVPRSPAMATVDLLGSHKEPECHYAMPCQDTQRLA